MQPSDPMFYGQLGNLKLFSQQDPRTRPGMCFNPAPAGASSGGGGQTGQTVDGADAQSAGGGGEGGPEGLRSRVPELVEQEKVLSEFRPYRWVDNFDSCSQGTELMKRLTKCRELKLNWLHLSFLNLRDLLLPNIVQGPTAEADFGHLRRLDLGYNQLTLLPPELGNLVNLRELWANDNPNLSQVPVRLSELRKLEVLDLRNTGLSKIPREYAELQSNPLVEMNLTGCPLSSPKLNKAYGEGYLSFFCYLHRKNDRRKAKRELVRIFREDLFPFDPLEGPPENAYTITKTVDRIFAQMKDLTSFDLRKLTRHAPRIMPADMRMIDHGEIQRIRARVEQIVEEDLNTRAIQQLTLKLRALYPDASLAFAGRMGHDIFYHFSEKDRRQMFSNRDRQFILSPNPDEVTLDAIALNLQQLRDERWYRRLCERILCVYEGVDGLTMDRVSAIFDCCLESCRAIQPEVLHRLAGNRDIFPPPASSGDASQQRSLEDQGGALQELSEERICRALASRYLEKALPGSFDLAVKTAEAMATGAGEEGVYEKFAEIAEAEAMAMDDGLALDANPAGPDDDDWDDDDGDGGDDGGPDEGGGADEGGSRAQKF